MTECRLLIDPPQHGAWNMAADEALLEWSGRTGKVALRFYLWEEPTLSLGYFQAYEARKQHPPSAAAPSVRRASGGGAIVHHRELTYSLVAPRADPLGVGRLRLYEQVHAALIDVLARVGLSARLCPGGCRSAAEPFLCFARRAPGDVLVGPHKVAGSAQRRSRAAVLQHGSLLLERSPAAPELPGLLDLAARRIEADLLRDAWIAELVGRLGLRWNREALSDFERDRARELVQEKYAADRWTIHRGRGPDPQRLARPEDQGDPAKADDKARPGGSGSVSL